MLDDRERGFTLIELMVVVLVIAILLAIAIPTMLGARTRAHDAVAKSHLKITAQVAAAWAPDSGYTGLTAAVLSGQESSLSYVDDPAVSTGPSVISVGADATSVALAAKSRSGRCWLMLSASTGVTYGSLSSSATCNAASARTFAVQSTWTGSAAFGPSVLASSGLIAYWPLSDAAGPVTERVSSSTSPTSGTVALGSPALAAGLSTSACFGADGLITTSYLQPSITAFTIAGWIKTTNSSAVLFQNRGPISSGQRGFSLTLSGFNGSAGVPQFQMDTDSIIAGVGGPSSIADNQRHFVVGTWAGTGGAAAIPSQFTLYVDGVAVSGSTKTYNSANAPFASNQPAVIGYHPAWGLTSPNTCMSDIAIWQRSLSAPEVTALYNAGLGL